MDHTAISPRCIAENRFPKIHILKFCIQKARPSQVRKFKTIIPMPERPKNPYNLPESYQEKREPFILPKVCNNILLISDLHIPYHDIDAITIALDYGKKENVNTLEFKQLLKNPYVDYKLCKMIFEYRDEVAELQDITELKNIKDFPLELYDRIVLYLLAE